jgi:hypothetical protein
MLETKKRKNLKTQFKENILKHTGEVKVFCTCFFSDFSDFLDPRALCTQFLFFSLLLMCVNFMKEVTLGKLS